MIKDLQFQNRGYYLPNLQKILNLLKKSRKIKIRTNMIKIEVNSLKKCFCLPLYLI